MIEVKCANCGKAVESPKQNSRYCKAPSTCRQDYNRLHRTPRAAVDKAIGGWLSQNHAALVADLLPDIVRAVKVEIRQAVRAAAPIQGKGKRKS